MNWDAAATVAEAIGALAVIVSLVYLSIQIRQNTRALRAASIDSTTQIANDIRHSLYADAEVTRIYAHGLSDLESLNDIDRERFRLLMTNALWALWNTYTQAHLGGANSWDAQKPLLRRFLSQPGGRWYWNSYKVDFEKAFQEEVDRILRDPA